MGKPSAFHALKNLMTKSIAIWHTSIVIRRIMHTVLLATYSLITYYIFTGSLKGCDCSKVSYNGIVTRCV